VQQIVPDVKEIRSADGKAAKRQSGKVSRFPALSLRQEMPAKRNIKKDTISKTLLYLHILSPIRIY
jgi:hypothetical protein